MITLRATGETITLEQFADMLLREYGNSAFDRDRTVVGIQLGVDIDLAQWVAAMKLISTAEVSIKFA